MKVQQLSSFEYNYSHKKYKLNDKTVDTNNVFYNQKPVSSFSSEKIKANFVPTFRRSETKIISLKERETNNDVQMKLTKISTGDYTSFKIYTMKDKEAGFLRLKLGKEIPVILELRSLAGDKVKGIGTTLVNEAIKESDKNGKNGCLWLRSLTGFGSSMSKYRKDENPIPFYYKLGFVAVDPSEDKHIKECLKNNSIRSLPNDTILMLTADVAKEKLKELN